MNEIFEKTNFSKAILTLIISFNKNIKLLIRTAKMANFKSTICKGAN